MLLGQNELIMNYKVSDWRAVKSWSLWWSKVSKLITSSLETVFV